MEQDGPQKRHFASMEYPFANNRNSADRPCKLPISGCNGSRFELTQANGAAPSAEANPD